MDYSNYRVIMTPAEREAEKASNQMSLPELDREIAKTTDPNKKATLVAERARIQAQGPATGKVESNPNWWDYGNIFWRLANPNSEPPADPNTDFEIMDEIISFFPSVAVVLLGIVFLILAILSTDAGKRVVNERLK